MASLPPSDVRVCCGGESALPCLEQPNPDRQLVARVHPFSELLLNGNVSCSLRVALEEKMRLCVVIMVGTYNSRRV